jgi:Arc/MetJ-type ribon-helix-helix transcriptional regulator
MAFKKITISLPENMYQEGMYLVKKGMYSNFSDLVRSGIREEIKELDNVRRSFDEHILLRDTEFKQSLKDAKEKKGVLVIDKEELDTYLDSL